MLNIIFPGHSIDFRIIDVVFSRVQLFEIPWTVAFQALLSMEFFRQELWDGLPFPTPVDLPSLEIEPTSLVCPALQGKFFTTVLPGKPKFTL